MTPAEILDACGSERAPTSCHVADVGGHSPCRACAEAAIAAAVEAERADAAKMRAEYPALVKLAQARCHCIYSQVPEAAEVLPALRTDYRCQLANDVARASEAAITAAVLAEREACAQEAEQQIALEIPGPNMKPVNWRERIAAIRARGSR